MRWSVISSGARRTEAIQVRWHLETNRPAAMDHPAGLSCFMEPLRIPITDVFDLHSVPPRDVREVTREYILEARKLGFEHLRIIHGRGIGVQREAVRQVLAEMECVKSWSDAPLEAGGWGATVVTLGTSPIGSLLQG